MSGESCIKLNPSGYVETQGEFAHRVAREVAQPDGGLACALEMEQQREFPEPRVRVNTDLLDHAS